MDANPTTDTVVTAIIPWRWKLPFAPKMSRGGGGGNQPYMFEGGRASSGINEQGGGRDRYYVSYDNINFFYGLDILKGGHIFNQELAAVKCQTLTSETDQL